MNSAPPEIYNLEVNGTSLRFVLQAASTMLPGPLAIVQRMGDPDLLECVVLRREASPGGVFRLENANGPLLAAIAADNLAFALGLGFFGELTANARYGVDVFENMEEPND